MLRSLKILACVALSLSLLAACAAGQAPKQYKVKVVAEYPHDTDSYTQGLFWHEGTFYESTGQNGKSTFRVVDLESGKALRKLDFGKEYFVEGSVILGDRLYILTWTSHVLFEYDAKTLEYRKSYSYPRDGWGLTTDGKSLVASDGSDRIFFMSEDLKLERTISVRLNGKPLNYLNELEWIDGKIWANVYTTDMIVIINPRNGVVEGIIDCTGLMPSYLYSRDTDVLNGVARNPEDGKIYFTGKNWPRLYQVEIVEK